MTILAIVFALTKGFAVGFFFGFILGAYSAGLNDAKKDDGA